MTYAWSGCCSEPWIYSTAFCGPLSYGTCFFCFRDISEKSVIAFMVNAEIYISDFREGQENKLQSLFRLTLCFPAVLGDRWLEHAVSLAEMCLCFPWGTGGTGCPALCTQWPDDRTVCACLPGLSLCHLMSAQGTSLCTSSLRLTGIVFFLEVSSSMIPFLCGLTYARQVF